MQREYTSIRSEAFSVEHKVNTHLAERTAAGWRLEHVTDRGHRGRARSGYEYSFFWVRDDNAL
jgi:hypothetical protein